MPNNDSSAGTKKYKKPTASQLDKQKPDDKDGTKGVMHTIIAKLILKAVLNPTLQRRQSNQNTF